MIRFENLKTGYVLLIILAMLAGCSKGILFDPDFHVGDHNVGGIVNDQGQVILATDVRFDGFACMSSDKIKELKQILMGSSSKKVRRVTMQEYRQLMSRVSPRQDFSKED